MWTIQGNYYPVMINLSVGLALSEEEMNTVPFSLYVNQRAHIQGVEEQPLLWLFLYRNILQYHAGIMSDEVQRRVAAS